MKLWNYIFIITGLVFLINLAGIDIGTTGIETIIGMIKGEVDISVSSFWNNLFKPDLGILVTIVTGSVIAGLFARAQLENFIILPFILTTLVLFAQVFTAIISYASKDGATWISSIVTLIFGALLIGFILALLEFFRGTD
jgi:hypothetical protein